MRKQLLLKTMLLLCALIAGSGTMWAAAGDILAKLTDTGGSSYADRITKTDSYSVGWVLSSSYSGIWGSNKNQKANIKPTEADLPVVKGVTSSATTSTQYHYFYYTTTAVSNVGSIEFDFTGTYDASTSCNVYIVMGDAKSAKGGDAYTKVELSSTSTTQQGASISSGGTYTFTFAETQTSAKYYGLVIKVANDSYKRFNSASLTLKEGSTAPTYTVTYDANGGSGTMTDSSSPYVAGATVTLLDNAFTAPAGNTFNGWAVTDASSNTVAVTNNQFTMPASNVTVTAQWLAIAGDYITVNPTSANIASSGDVAEFGLTTNIESPSYAVAYYTSSTGEEATTKPSWIGDVEFSDNTLDVAVNANTGAARSAYLKVYSGDTYSPVITINQAAATYDIAQYTTLATAHGTITFSPASPVETGAEVTLTATPAAGYTFTADSWVFYKESGEDIVVDNSIAVTDGKITMPAYELYVDATFAAIPISSVGLNKTSASLKVGETLTLTATVLPNDAPDKSVTWESDDTDVATVTSAGVVTAVGEGTATITVKSVADPTKKAECTITVVDGSIDLTKTGEISFGNPFTSGEIGSGGYKTQDCELTGSDNKTYTWKEVDGYYNDGGWQIKKTSGKVTSPIIKSDKGFTISTTKGTNDVIISDGTTSGTNSLTTTKTNTTITITGDGAYAVFTAIKITPTKDPIATDVSFTAPGTLAKGATGTFAATSTDVAACTKAWASSDASVIEITDAATGAYEAKGRGTAKITLTITPTDAANYGAVTAERNVSVTAPVVITASDVEMTYGDAAKAIGATASTGYAGTLTYESDNTNIATVDASGKVTAIAAGTTIITISAPADAENLYTAGEDKVINVTVSAPAGETTAADFTQYYEYYEALTSNTKASDWTYNSWTSTSSYGACSPEGSSSQLITKNYQIPNNVNPCLSFQHTGKTFSTPSSACKLYVQEGSNTPVELTIPEYFTGGNWTYVESGDIDLKSYAGKTVHFIFDYTPSEGNAGKWEVKEFYILYDAFGIKLNASGYATYCSEYPLDFSDASGYSAWQITEVSADAITFEQVTGTVKGGTGLLLKGTPNASITLKSADSTNELAGNLLVGTTAPTYVAADTYFGLKGNTFVPVNAGTVKAGKALLPKSAIPSNARDLSFIFDETTGVKTVHSSQFSLGECGDASIVHSYYNLNGQRVQNPRNGLYIVNGKKVMIK